MIDVASARDLLKGRVVRTPLVPAPALSERTGGDIYLKLESIQPTGSFKVRGATTKIMSIPKSSRGAGVVAASTGNHGRAVAYVARGLEMPVTVCVSSGVPAGKIAALEELGATVEIVGRSQTDAVIRARQIADDTGAVLVHPFDDPIVIAGQGTIAIEIVEDLSDVSRVVVPLSGGGLLGGVAIALAEIDPKVETLGVSMERSAVMAASLEAGHPVDLPEEQTLADSLLGDIGLDNQYTFRIVSDLVHDVVQVDEDAIWEAMGLLLDQHRLVTEGAGAVPVAALLRDKVDVRDGPTVLVISGANVEKEHIRALAAGEPPLLP